MKNKKLIVIGISIAMIMCVAVGCGCGNSEAMETVATLEAEEPTTIEEVEESTQPIEEAPAVKESVEKEEEKEEATETATKEEAAETKEESDYIKEAEELWGQHSEEFECNYETFRENYTEERENGSDKETAYETVYSILKKVEESIPESSYEIIPLDPQSMYATQACNIRSGPSTDYDKIGSLSYAEEVTITGKVENSEGKIWYVLEKDEVQMVSGSLLSSTKPQPVSVNPNSGTTINSVDKEYNTIQDIQSVIDNAQPGTFGYGKKVVTGDGSIAAGMYGNLE